MGLVYYEGEGKKMLQKSSDLKRRAKEQLQGKWLQAGLVCFIAWLVTITFTGGNAVHSVQNVWQNGELISVPTTNSSNGLGGLLSFILSGPITLGVSCYFLKLIRNEGPFIENMFGGFKFFVKSFVLNLLIKIFYNFMDFASYHSRNYCCFAIFHGILHYGG